MKQQSDNTILILPFTNHQLYNPSTILPLIFKAALQSKNSTVVVFTTPHSSESLYEILRENAQANFKLFQTFLGRVYAALGAGQWRSGRVLMDVEVQFDDNSERDDWDLRLRTGRPGIWRIMEADNLEMVPVVTKIHELLPNALVEKIQVSNPTSDTNFSANQPMPDHSKEGFRVVALGGTFDHLHAAHKLLLHSAYFISTRKLIVGLMADRLLSSKSNADLVQPLSTRISIVREFLERLNPSIPIKLDIVEIQDPYGPTRYESDIQALVVSAETLSGGEAVNKVRKDGGLSQLEVVIVDVIASEVEVRDDVDAEGKVKDLTGIQDEKALKDLKMGSTAIRHWIKENGER